jgi:hypothetical protein
MPPIPLPLWRIAPRHTPRHHFPLVAILLPRAHLSAARPTAARLTSHGAGRPGPCQGRTWEIIHLSRHNLAGMSPAETAGAISLIPGFDSGGGPQ